MVDRARLRPLRVLAFAVAIAACGGSGSGDTSGGVEFSQVYATIVGARCAPCHSPGQPGFVYGLLDMSTEETAYSNLVGVKAAGPSCKASDLTRVLPGSAATSLMFNKVNAKLTQIAAPCGDTMPDDQTVLDQAQVNLIATWINDGAEK